MKQSRLQEIVDVYTNGGDFTVEQERLVRLACENVERETRQDAVSATYDLANKLAQTPRD